MRSHDSVHRDTLHRAQSGPYTGENPLLGREVALILGSRTAGGARQQTQHCKNFHDWAHPLLHESSDYYRRPQVAPRFNRVPQRLINTEAEAFDGAGA